MKMESGKKLGRKRHIPYSTEANSNDPVSGSQSTELLQRFQIAPNCQKLTHASRGGDHEKVSVFFYLNGNAQTIHFIALDAQKDAEGANYRFDIDKATYEMLVKESPHTRAWLLTLFALNSKKRSHSRDKKTW